MEETKHLQHPYLKLWQQEEEAWPVGWRGMGGRGNMGWVLLDGTETNVHSNTLEEHHAAEWMGEKTERSEHSISSGGPGPVLVVKRSHRGRTGETVACQALARPILLISLVLTGVYGRVEDGRDSYPVVEGGGGSAVVLGDRPVSFLCPTLITTSVQEADEGHLAGRFYD